MICPGWGLISSPRFFLFFAPSGWSHTATQLYFTLHWMRESSSQHFKLAEIISSLNLCRKLALYLWNNNAHLALQAFWRSSWLKSVACWMLLRYRDDRLKLERKHGRYRMESKQPVDTLFSITAAKSDRFCLNIGRLKWNIASFFIPIPPNRSLNIMYQDNGVRPITVGWWDFCVPGYCLTLSLSVNWRQVGLDCLSQKDLWHNTSSHPLLAIFSRPSASQSHSAF